MREAFRCYWPGGPLDPYRRACLASYGRHGHCLELVCERPPAELPPGVTTQSLQAMTPASRLKAQLLSSHPLSDADGGWIPLDLLQLRPRAATFEAYPSPLAWIEAFKLWLPEFAPELRQRARHWPQVPLHLSFAELAGLDLQCLPPEHSFLAELLEHQAGEIADESSPVPRPRHNVQGVRRHLQRYLSGNQHWALPPLQTMCETKELRQLELIQQPSFGHRLRRKARSCARKLRNALAPQP